MAHFLNLDRFDRAYVGGRPRAMVTVELVARKRLQVQDGISVAKADVEWYPLPSDMEVVGPDGTVLKPSTGRQFFVTVETFNPFHGLMEASAQELHR